MDIIVSYLSFLLPLSRHLDLKTSLCKLQVGVLNPQLRYSSSNTKPLADPSLLSGNNYPGHVRPVIIATIRDSHDR